MLTEWIGNKEEKRLWEQQNGLTNPFMVIFGLKFQICTYYLWIEQILLRSLRFILANIEFFLTSFKPATKITRKVMRFPFNMYRVNLYMVQRWNWIVAILFRAMIDILLLSHFSSLHIHEINIRELIMTLLQYPELIKKVLYWCMYGICF